MDGDRPLHHWNICKLSLATTRDMGTSHSINEPAGRRLFQRRLLGWYQRNKRDLPWRANRDPYRVWLSEIMLQQTRVAAVVEYYRRFLQRFPTVEALASASESDVLAAWSGLGYYRRAPMLHAASKKIVDEYGGEFPNTAAALLSLPGIGRYTSAAIASIAFDEPVAVVDGNVERVVRRVTGTPLVGEPMWQVASQLLDPKQPGNFNQAMMELGATVCAPQVVDCPKCPVVSFCATRGAGLPKLKPVRRKREIHYTLNCRNRSVLLVQRAFDESLMPGMWELPEVVADDQMESWLTVRHSITVTDYTVRVVRDLKRVSKGEWVTMQRIEALPLTGLTRKILRAAKILSGL
jgi:A/G-specific adenine glycosylase